MTAAQWLTSERLSRYPKLFLGVYVVVMIAWASMADGLIDRSGTPLGGDFISFYSAGRLAASITPEAAYDPVRHGALQQAITGQGSNEYYAFAYPPSFLLLTRAIATLPYLPAFLVWQLFSLTALALFIARIWGDRRSVWFVLGFPATFNNFIHGQTAFLSAALVAWFTLTIRTSPWQAGIALGLSSFKPHFVLAMGLVVLITRQWRAMVSAFLTGIGLFAASLLLFGTETWKAFLELTPKVGTLMLENGGPGWHKMVSLFAMLRQLGLPLTPAMTAQIVVTALSGVALFVFWRKMEWIGSNSGRSDKQFRTELAFATVAMATILMTPYALDYDLVILGVAIAYLARGLRALNGNTRGIELALIALWIMPFATRPLAQSGFPIAAPVMLAVMFAIYKWHRSAHNALQTSTT